MPAYPDVLIPDPSRIWDNQTIKIRPFEQDNQPEFCRYLISEPGVWTFWSIYSAPNVHEITLPDLQGLIGYSPIPTTQKAMNITCGIKPGLDFNNFTILNTSQARLSSYSVDMVKFK